MTTETSEDSRPEQHNLRRPNRLRRWVYYWIYVVVATIGILLVIELLLGLIYLVTDSSMLELVAGSDVNQAEDDREYPRNPEQYIKIAVFGGSAAAGQTACYPSHIRSTGNRCARPRTGACN